MTIMSNEMLSQDEIDALLKGTDDESDSSKGAANMKIT